MQNTKPPSLASAVGSSAANVLDRVVAIAPAPLLPGEKEAEYAQVALRIVGASRPRDAIEEILIRDVIDLTWEVLRLRRVKAGILSRRSRNQKGVRRLSKNHPRLSGQCWMIRRFTFAQIVPATRVQG
jgi:hypothetical protein